MNRIQNEHFFAISFMALNKEKSVNAPVCVFITQQ